jgi:hypothetical protein
LSKVLRIALNVELQVIVAECSDSEVNEKLAKGSMENHVSVLRRRDLFKVKLRALRSGIWFKALKGIDRALVDLTLRIDREVHSATLLDKLMSVVLKLEAAFEGRVLCALHEVGFSCAKKMSLIAQKWGNRSARGWEHDVIFARFLAVMYINSPERQGPGF